ncbi:hypothetical protein, partial [Neisseria bergeri]|uniref:hypothetical protein n=1 Tax=Neisseria bergeri TaxID=1906581 RepID=UPI00272B6152
PRQRLSLQPWFTPKKTGIFCPYGYLPYYKRLNRKSRGNRQWCVSEYAVSGLECVAGMASDTASGACNMLS